MKKENEWIIAPLLLGFFAFLVFVPSITEWWQVGRFL